ncbi:hypothetical protein PoB_000732200 [Plakobranchus ocellatus]|uniref:Uncharacterized protein n=1 Tax=Plakobranchus ocellatus TaxID=259542 RepID=A0AAV3YED4_9GAST|nr:hypothetical protein PoB_000732200 [Plakobranchus ocellatus]
MRHRRWTMRQSENTLWSDEPSFLVEGRDGRLRVYRRQRECFANNRFSEVGNKERKCNGLGCHQCKLKDSLHHRTTTRQSHSSSIHQRSFGTLIDSLST